MTEQAASATIEFWRGLHAAVCESRGEPMGYTFIEKCRKWYLDAACQHSDVAERQALQARILYLLRPKHASQVAWMSGVACTLITGWVQPMEVWADCLHVMAAGVGRVCTELEEQVLPRAFALVRAGSAHPGAAALHTAAMSALAAYTAFQASMQRTADESRAWVGKIWVLAAHDLDFGNVLSMKAQMRILRLVIFETVYDEIRHDVTLSCSDITCVLADALEAPGVAAHAWCKSTITNLCSLMPGLLLSQVTKQDLQHNRIVSAHDVRYRFFRKAVRIVMRYWSGHGSTHDPALTFDEYSRARVTLAILIMEHLVDSKAAFHACFDIEDVNAWVQHDMIVGIHHMACLSTLPEPALAVLALMDMADDLAVLDTSTMSGVGVGADTDTDIDTDDAFVEHVRRAAGSLSALRCMHFYTDPQSSMLEPPALLRAVRYAARTRCIQVSRWTAVRRAWCMSAARSVAFLPPPSQPAHGPTSYTHPCHAAS